MPYTISHLTKAQKKAKQDKAAAQAATQAKYYPGDQSQYAPKQPPISNTPAKAAALSAPTPYVSTGKTPELIHAEKSLADLWTALQDPDASVREAYLHTHGGEEETRRIRDRLQATIDEQKAKMAADQQSGNEKYNADLVAYNARSAYEKQIADKAAQDKAIADQIAANKITQDKAYADQLAAIQATQKQAIFAEQAKQKLLQDQIDKQNLIFSNQAAQQQTEDAARLQLWKADPHYVNGTLPSPDWVPGAKPSAITGSNTPESQAIDRLAAQQQADAEAARARALRESAMTESFNAEGQKQQNAAESARQRFLTEQQATSGIFNQEAQKQQDALNIFRKQYQGDIDALNPLFAQQGQSQMDALNAAREKYLQEQISGTETSVEKMNQLLQPQLQRNITAGANQLGGRGIGTGGFEGSGAVQEMVRKASQQIGEQTGLAGMQNLINARNQYANWGVEAARIPGIFGNQQLQNQVAGGTDYANLGLKGFDINAGLGNQNLANQIGARNQYSQLGLEASRIPGIFGKANLENQVGANQNYVSQGLQAAQTPSIFGQAALSRLMQQSDILNDQQFQEHLAELGANAQERAAANESRAKRKEAIGGLVGAGIGSFGGPIGMAVGGYIGSGLSSMF